MNRFHWMVAGSLAAAILFSGCGGTSLNSNVSRIRAYDGATATTSSSTVYINNGSANGSQNYGQVSNYLYVNSGTSNFSWAVNNLSGGKSTAFSANLSSGSVYSCFLLGRADEEFGTGSPILDISVDDQTAPPGGSARIRLVHNAPDANAVDVYVNGSLLQSDYAYPGTTIVGITPAQLALGTPFSLQNFAYSNVAGGSVTIKVTETGSATVVAQGTFSVTSGSRYTFILNEPTVTPAATYTIQQIGDSL